MRKLLIGSGVMLMFLVSCGPTPASVCQAQCEKRQACGTKLDLAQCKKACQGPVAERSAACAEADLVLQQCQVRQPCDAYLASQGCESEAAAMVSSCR